MAENPNPNSMAARIANATPFVVTRKTEPSALRVALDLLDPNPYQPRTTMDETKLKELATSIASTGLLQPIAVKREGERWVIIAGHRRTEAFRRLRAAAETDTERARWSEIPALEVAGVDATKLAALSFIENEQRENLSILDTATAIARMLDDKLYESVEAAATALGKSVTRVKDLRRLASAPPILKQAIGSGLRIAIGKDETGAERFEVRRLELSNALAFLTVYDHLQKGKRADARLESVLRKALAGNWSARRAEEFARDVRKGKEAVADTELTEPDALPVFSESPTRFVIDKKRLASASASDRAALRAAIEALLVGQTSG